MIPGKTLIKAVKKLRWGCKEQELLLFIIVVIFVVVG